jgi:hypothetical protein
LFSYIEHGPVVQHQKEEEEQQHVPKGKQKKQQKKKGATAESLEPRKNERIEE